MELYSRPTSSIPISIGTSLALETIFTGTQEPYDPQRKIPDRIELSNYDECWFNIASLIRNIASSVERVRYSECTVDHVLEILNSEIDIINSIFQIEGKNICKPVFFISSYKSIRARNKSNIEFRESTTVIQKSYDLKLQQILDKLEKMTDSIYNFDSELKPKTNTRALILTHHAYDLTSVDKFHKLDLLESHTGVVKTRYQWNTKYAPLGNEALTNLPFNKELLFIFGDKNQIAPQKWKIRKDVYDISIKDRWTPYTSVSRIKQSYKTSNLHPADIALLLSF